MLTERDTFRLKTALGNVPEYVRKGGAFCPACLGTDYVGESFDMDGGAVRQAITCSNCRATWTDVYSLVGVDDLKLGDQP